MAPLTAADFRLEQADLDDDFVFRAPMRSGALVEPLIDGVDTFRAMERAIARARKSVHLTFWSFDPDTPLLLPQAPGTSLRTWADLLVAVAAEGGAEVRVILNDFDPLVRTGDHRATWRAHRLLVEAAKRLDLAAQHRFQVICSLHDAETSHLADFLLRTTLANTVTERAAQLNATLKKSKTGRDEANKAFSDMPGLWPYVEFDERKQQFSAVSRPLSILGIPAFVASHHQKSCVVDGAIAFCGGLDVTPHRIDSQKHEAPHNRWHDIHCRLEGPPVEDIQRNFVGRWRREEPRFRDFVQHVNELRPLFRIHTRPTSPLVTIPASPSARRGEASVPLGGASVQVIRTVSVDSPQTLPRILRQDIEEMYTLAIGRAQQFLYIENQFMREAKVRDALIKQRKQFPQLRVIIVLPVAPEEITQGPKPDPGTLHGMHLQLRVLTDLRTEFGQQLGLFSMVERHPSRNQPDHPTDAHRLTFPSTQIFVHSKCLIVDDVFASIGSPNANGRSLRVDTELAISWFEPAKVRAFRVTLWNELLGSPRGLDKWPIKDFIRKWEQIAKANAAAPPRKRRGFIVPHDENNPHVRGERHPVRDKPLIGKDLDDLV
jgi:phosphatidylserine/phosphatidylglycerophosphate/cardiolipin synthase-like enzyme